MCELRHFLKALIQLEAAKKNQILYSSRATWAGELTQNQQAINSVSMLSC